MTGQSIGHADNTDANAGSNALVLVTKSDVPVSTVFPIDFFYNAAHVFNPDPILPLLVRFTFAPDTTVAQGFGSQPGDPYMLVPPSGSSSYESERASIVGVEIVYVDLSGLNADTGYFALELPLVSPSGRREIIVNLARK